MSDQTKQPTKIIQLNTTKSDLQELKDDIREGISDGILNDLLKNEKTKNILKLVKPFIGPALKQAIKSVVEQAIKNLGEDDVRYMFYRDPETRALVLQKLYTNKMKLEFEEPEASDLVIIQETENENDRMNKIIEKICSTIGMDANELKNEEGELDMNKIMEKLMAKLGGNLAGKLF